MERRRVKRWQKVSAIAGGLLMAAFVVIVLVFTQTDYGRKRFRTIGLNQLASQVHGIVELGRVHGNLLTGATIENVVITDSAGRPFLRADSLSLKYSLRSLFRKHIVLEDVRLIKPVVVLEQPPGGKWNFQRLFPGDSANAAQDSTQGFGDWLRIEGLTLVDGSVTVRRAWTPPRRLQGDALEAAIRRALSPENREMVVRVDSGYQALSSYTRINGHMPLVIWADPDSSGRLIDIGRLNMIAQPFRPPVATIKDMKGRVTIGKDTVGFHDLAVTLPASQLNVVGYYSMRTSEVNVSIHAPRMQFADMRFVYPALPDGSGSLNIAMGRAGDLTRVVVSNMDVATEGARIAGGIDLQYGRVQHINSSALRFEGVDTRLVEKVAQQLDLPFEGVMDGRLKLAGDPAALDVDGFVNIHDRAGATSRITADGVIGNRNGTVIARNLQLDFDPVRVSLVKTIRPDLPIGGVINGRATLNGDLLNRFDIDADVVHEDAATGRSHIVAAGDLSVKGDFRTRGLRMRFDPVQAALLQAFKPDLDLDGQITGRATLVGGLVAGFEVDADVYHTSRATGRSHVIARGGINTRDGFTARRLHLRFEPLQMALVRSFQPDLKVGGVLTGRATVSGGMRDGFQIDADVVHDDAATGRSHVYAVGGVETADGFVARNLKLRFEPLQVALLRTFDPTIPLDGVVTGRATVNGSLARRITTDFDVAHEGSTGKSSVAGDAELTFAGALQRVDLNMRARPLSLATAGLFAPAAGLRGSATGTIRATGNRDNIRFTTDLAIADGGAVAATGSIALGDVMRYDIRSSLVDFDPSAISTRAPTAMLSGTVIAGGVGTDPATANARVDVALVDSRLPGAPQLDSTRLVARFQDGLATVEQGRIRLASALADIEGTFGLTAARTGTLRYSLAIDTLSRVAAFATGDTSVVYPRPLQQARRIAQARADSARIAAETEVERAATGSPPPPRLAIDSIRAIARDSVAGVVRADGVLAGNIKRFDATGTATLRDMLFRGHQVQSGDVTYAVTNAPGTSMGAKVNARLTGVRTSGFGFDSANVILDHTGGTRQGVGTFDLALFQDASRDYRVKSDFVLALDRKELRLNDLLLRFDSTVWRGTQQGTVSWAASDIALRAIDLRNDRGGHISADGVIPDEGSGDLRLAIDSLQIGDIAALLQDTLNTRGILSLDTRVRGSLRAPLFSGTASLDSATRGGVRMPDLVTTFSYAANELTAEAQLRAGVQLLVDAQVRLPVDLAFTGRAPGATRLLDGPISIDARMDSLPLDAMPSFTAAVQEVRGVVRGDIGVRGTYDAPILTGGATMQFGSMRVVQPNIILAEGFASLSMNENRVVIDSLVALSGGGPIRASGTLDLTTLTRPGFDLNVIATDALMLNNHLGNIKADAALEVKGPYDAVRVTGTIAVQDGVINAPEQNQTRRATDLDDPTLANVLDTLDAPLKFRRGPNPLLKNMQADVQVTVARDTWVRNSTMNVEVYTPDDEEPLRVRVDNAKQAFTLEGIINADRGEYSVAGRQFKLSTGSVTFLGTAAMDPLLQLSAQYEVPRRTQEALTILINIGGYLTAPRLTLSSNAQPPLPQSDLISYLAFGHTSSSLLSPQGSGLGGGGLTLIAQQQLAGLGLGALTDALVRGFEDQGIKAGLDVFRIQPGVLPDELNFNGYFENMFKATQIEAGEYLGSHLFVALEGRPAATLPGVRAEYQTPGGFSLETTWLPRFLPSRPSLTLEQARQARVFGTFFFYTRRF